MMKLVQRLTLSVCCVASLGLTACQSLPQAQTTKPISSQSTQYLLQGKIGVKTPQQSGSAFFVWQQNNTEYHIELSGILGVGKTIIQGNPQGVSLKSAKTGLIEANTPEELLYRATGWQAPITHLQHWVQGRPATLTAQFERDTLGRNISIEEDHWNIQLTYSGEMNVPDRLVLIRQVAEGEHRITMVIQQRQDL